MRNETTSTAARRRFTLALGAACLITGVPGYVAGQTVQPPPVSQEVFVTASPEPLPLLSLPRSAFLVTRDDLDRLGVTSIVDALRLVPGLDPRARGPRGVQTDLSIRGATFGQNLVLLDGVRLNDAQSGHHNGEFPLSLENIDRIEVLYGAGSAIHGADALGGTINIISRRGAHAVFSADAGQHGYASVSGSLSGNGLPVGWTVDGWGNRSSGFTFDRDFAQGGLGLRGTPRPGLTLDVRHARRAFGANGFYGNSPSKEWTDQTLASAGWQRAHGNVVTGVRASFKDHHDHFRWDINRPGFAENRHRSNAADVSATVSREFEGGRRGTVGVSGGRDWIASTNLGDHAYSRVGVFGEVVLPVGARTLVQSGLRLDAYSTFGRSLNPTLAFSTQMRPALRVHGSAGRAFRIPTFTELYYTDPGNLGTPTLTPEQGWSLDGGVEWSPRGWTWSFSPFRRWDRDVIDWVRPTAADLWRSTNVRDVTSTGFEAAIVRRWGEGFLRLYYAGLKVDAPALTVLSKYVLEYARHQSGGSLALPVGSGVRLALNVDHRHRLDGQSYDLVSARLSRSVGRAEIHLDGSNLLNESYREIVGVAMPGRWVTAGVTLR